MLGQVAVATAAEASEAKAGEIGAIAPLLDTLTGIDLTDVVLTADALHTQRGHVEDLHRRGAHCTL